jgi:NTE family protein
MRALVLSGGGSKGAYQCGALKYILGELNVIYDAFCGVSVGAINCAYLSMFPTGEEKKSVDTLVDMWQSMTTEKVYKRWFPFGRLHALWNRSFFDSSPLSNLLRAGLDLEKIRNNGKLVNVGTVSLSSGKYTIFDQKSDHFIDAVVASAAFPGMLSPVKFLGQLWTDGGVKEISPIKKAVELGADIIDIIITSPQTRVNRFIKNPTTVDILKRSFDLSTDKIMANDIEKIEMHNKLALAGVSDRKFVKINILRPDYNLIEDLLDFSHERISEMMEKGFTDAKYRYIQ